MENMKSVIKKGFECYKKNWLVSSLFSLEYIAVSFLSICFVLFFSLNFILPGVNVGIVLGSFRILKILIEMNMPFMMPLVNIAGFALIVIYFISRMVYLRFILSRTKTEDNVCFKTSFYVLIADIFLTITNILGAMLFIIPGIFLSIRHKFVRLIILDSENKNIKEALDESAKIAKGNYKKLFRYSLAIFLATHASLILCFIIFVISSLFIPGLLGEGAAAKIIWSFVIIFYTVCMPVGYYANSVLYEIMRKK